MQNIKLSYNTNGWALDSLKNALEFIAKCGYKGIDLLCDTPFAYPANMTKKKIKDLRNLLDSLGLTVANASANKATPLRMVDEHWAEPSLANPNKEKREKRIKYIKEVVDLAVELNAQETSVVSGIFNLNDPDELWPIFVESLGVCVDYSADRGMKMAIEPEPDFLVETTDELLRIIKEINSKWFGAQYDIGHSIAKGETPIKCVKKLGKKIFHVHIEDIKGKKHFHRIPSAGEADLKGFIQALKEIGYSGFLTVELYTYTHKAKKATQQSIKYLKEIM